MIRRYRAVNFRCGFMGCSNVREVRSDLRRLSWDEARRPGRGQTLLHVPFPSGVSDKVPVLRLSTKLLHSFLSMVLRLSTEFMSNGFRRSQQPHLQPIIVGMTLAHRQLSVSDEYVCSLGYAVYAFSYLEWGAIYIADTLKPGYIRDDLRRLEKIGKERRKRSAGQIACDLERLIEQAVGRYPHLYDRMKAFHAEFTALARQRNKLLHSNPYTVKGREGEQRLQFVNEQDWPVDEIDRRAQRFEAASQEAGALRKALTDSAASVPMERPEG
jgi:hypothetical protein